MSYKSQEPSLSSTAGVADKLSPWETGLPAFYQKLPSCVEIGFNATQPSFSVGANRGCGKPKFVMCELTINLHFTLMRAYFSQGSHDVCTKELKNETVFVVNSQLLELFPITKRIVF